MDNVFTSFFGQLDISGRKKGSVSVIAQSGGILDETMRRLFSESIGFNKLVSIGNKLDLNENDFLEFMIADPESRTIVLYLEHMADGRRLMNIAAGCDKPMIMLKSNRSSSSSEIAKFHTSALAGDDAVADVAFRQAGFVRVQSMQDMFNMIKIFSLPVLKGPNLAAFGRSGGQAVLIADAVHRYGFKLARLSEAFFNLAKQAARAGVIRFTNPLDTGDILNLPLYEKLMEKAVQHQDVDGLIISFAHYHVREIEPTKSILRVAKRLTDQYGKPILFCMAPDLENHYQKEKADFPVFDDVDVGLKTLSLSYEHARRRRVSAGAFKPLQPAATGKKKIAVTNAGDILALLEECGLPSVRSAVVNSEKDALAQAKRLGYPVALKTASVEILHKTEAGGVMLGIQNPAELKKSLMAMTRKLRKQGMEPGGYLLQKMAPRGIEAFIGGKQDPEFGPVILFGLGGIFVEVMKDVVMRIAPVDIKTARDMIDEIKGAALLKGFRGQPPADVAALAKCIVNASKLLAEHREIVNLDINPLIVLEKGKGCLVVDANIEIK
jgi:acetyltransferase